MLFSMVGANGSLRCMNTTYTESLGEWSVYFLVADYFKCGKVEVESQDMT